MEAKAERTRRLIVEKASSLFNRQGYHGTSMSDIMEATGLAKGGLYGHFKSKDEIIAEAFEYAFYKVMDELGVRVRSQNTAIEKLDAIVEYYAHYLHLSTVEGGCPILNYTSHSMNALPALSKLLAKAANTMLESLERILVKGQKYAQIRADIVPSEHAALIYSRIEGALMLSKATKDGNMLLRLMEALRLDIRRDLQP
jgi:TetR/AcrR family transcriptional regulator, transcriptional repressor for nem operon